MPIDQFSPLALSIDSPTQAQQQFDLKDRDYRLLTLLLLDTINSGGAAADATSVPVAVTNAGQVLVAAATRGRIIGLFNHGPDTVYINGGAAPDPTGPTGIPLEIGDYYETPTKSIEAWSGKTAAGETARVQAYCW